MAGRPKGSRNRHSTKRFSQALRMELAGDDDEFKVLRKIAKGLIGRAVKGDIAAIREVANRLEGRPPQAVEMNGELTITHEEALAQLD